MGIFKKQKQGHRVTQGSRELIFLSKYIPL